MKIDRRKQIQSRYKELIESIIFNALTRIEGILRIDEVDKRIIKDLQNPISVNQLTGALEIDVVIDVIYGKSISEMSCSLQELIKNQIENKTKFAIRKINIHVQNIII